MAKESVVARETNAKPMNAVYSVGRRTLEQRSRQMLNVMNMAKDILGSDYRAYVSGRKKTTSKVKLKALSRLDRANKSYNKIIKNG